MTELLIQIILVLIILNIVAWDMLLLLKIILS